MGQRLNSFPWVVGVAVLCVVLALGGSEALQRLKEYQESRQQAEEQAFRHQMNETWNCFFEEMKESINYGWGYTHPFYNITQRAKQIKAELARELTQPEEKLNTTHLLSTLVAQSEVIQELSEAIPKELHTLVKHTKACYARKFVHY